MPAYSQEGWRLEHEYPNDKTSQIVFKGVVYNEMKGAFVSLNLLCGIFSPKNQVAFHRVRRGCIWGKIDTLDNGTGSKRILSVELFQLWCKQESEVTQRWPHWMCCHLVNDSDQLYLCTVRWGHFSHSPFNTMFLGLHESVPQTGPWCIQTFLQGADTLCHVKGKGKGVDICYSAS